MDWGGEVKWSLMKFFWFIQQDIMSKTGQDFTGVNYDIVFNTDVIINESETILNCVNSAGHVSARTIAANHPWTLDAEKELEELKKETEQTFELESEYASNPQSNSNGGSSSGEE